MSEDIEQKNDLIQKNTISKSVQYVLLLCIGIVFLYFAFRKQNLSEIFSVIEQSNLIWVVPVLIASGLGLIIRTLRWQQLIVASGFKAKFFDLFSSLLIGYAVNYAVPRLGEVTRCMTLQKKEDIPFAKLFGTVLSERLVDMVMLVLTVLLAITIKHELLYQFFSINIFEPIITLVVNKFQANQKIFYVIICLSVLGLIWVLTQKKEDKLKIEESDKESTSSKIDKAVDDIWKGVSSIVQVENKSLFIFYSIMIWILYFCTTYFWFFAFEPTKDLGWEAGVTIMLIGTLGRSVPIQGGGMGAYHFLVNKGLNLFGVSDLVGNAFAIVNHGFQAIFQLTLAAICSVIFFRFKK